MQEYRFRYSMLLEGSLAVKARNPQDAEDTARTLIGSGVSVAAHLHTGDLRLQAHLTSVPGAGLVAPKIDITRMKEDR